MEAELSEWSWGDLEMPNHGTGTIVHICDMLDRVLWAFVACMLYRGDREAGRGTELKHTHFTTPPSLHPILILIHSALSDAVPLSSQKSSFFPYRKHAGRRGGGEKKKKNASEATRERERKQRKLVVEREGEERGVDQMEGRKERISPRAQVRD